MRYLLIFLAVLLIAWRWRSSRSAPKPTARQPQSATPSALTMVRCSHCGVHLPAHDAVQGTRSSYCSADHLRQAEP